MLINSFPDEGLAIVVGANGGIGGAIADRLQIEPAFAETIGFGRHGTNRLDLTDEDSIRSAAEHIAGMERELRLVIDATGFLHGNGYMPEKSWRRIDPSGMALAFAINAIGPMLLMKHFLPLLPRRGKSVFASLSARVGSIDDNHSGGWYSYRASKAALNQLVRTSAIELTRMRPDAICVALHPGTVDSNLSAPFAKRGLSVWTPSVAAGQLLSTIDELRPDQSGGFYDYQARALPW